MAEQGVKSMTAVVDRRSHRHTKERRQYGCLLMVLRESGCILRLMHIWRHLSSYGGMLLGVLVVLCEGLPGRCSSSLSLTSWNLLGFSKRADVLDRRRGWSLEYRGVVCLAAAFAVS